MLRRLAILSTCALLAAVFGLLGGCSEKTAAGNHDTYKDIGKTFDDSEPPPTERKPVKGANLSKMSDANKARFEKELAEAEDNFDETLQGARQGGLPAGILADYYDIQEDMQRG